MFSQKQSNDLKVGDFVIIGCNVNGAFIQSKYGARIRVEKITVEKSGDVRFDLDWSGLGKSRVYLHDEDKIWKRVANFN